MFELSGKRLFISAFLVFLTISQSILPLITQYDAPIKFICFVTAVLMISRSVQFHEFFDPLIILMSVIIISVAFISSDDSVARLAFNALGTLVVLTLPRCLVISSDDFSRVLFCAGLLTGLLYSAAVIHLTLTSSTLLVGLSRYEAGGENFNHLAIIIAFALVIILTQRGRFVYFKKASLVIAVACAVSLILLMNKTVFLSLLITFVCLRNWRFRVFRYVVFLVPVLNLLFFLQIERILDFLTHYSLYDLAHKASSGRTTFWYFASDSGNFDLLSNMFQDSDLLIDRTTYTGHATAYMHNSYLDFLINYGVLFLILIVLLISRLSFSPSPEVKRFIGPILVVVVMSSFESVMDPQKIGYLILFMLSYLTVSNFRTVRPNGKWLC